MGKASYKLVKQSKNEYAVLKNNVFAYLLTFRNKRWTCDCPARKACKHLDMLPDEAKVKRFPREEITNALRKIEHLFANFPWEVVGSYRRERPDSKDIDIILQCEPQDFVRLQDALMQLEEFELTSGGYKIVKGELIPGKIIHGSLCGIPIDIDRVEGYFYSHLLYRTGPANLNIKMRSLAKSKGLTLSEKTPSKSEAELFELVDMPYLTPKERRQYE